MNVVLAFSLLPAYRSVVGKKNGSNGLSGLDKENIQ